MADDARQQSLVSTEWVAARADDDRLRLVEVDVDARSYDDAHIDGAVGWNWETQLCDPVRRDILTREDYQALLSSSGIDNDTTIVFYGDNNNWFAAYALWQCVYWGHAEANVRLMDGGRAKWMSEGRATTADVPRYDAADYTAGFGDDNVRARSHDIVRALGDDAMNLVDVRSPAEYSGDVIAPPGMAETAQRGGHLPGALNVPWTRTIDEDGTFLSTRLIPVRRRRSTAASVKGHRTRGSC